MEKKDNIEWISEIKKGKRLIEINFIEIVREGKPDIRVCKLATRELLWKVTPSYMFIWIEWYAGIGSDAGFFYRTAHMRDWKIVPIAAWMGEYKNKKDFLEDYPEVKELFWDHPPISKGKKEITFSGDYHSKVVVGDAFFDGEYLRIIDENGKEFNVKPDFVESIKSAENDDCKSDNTDW